MTHDEMIEAVALALVNRDQERFDLPRIETVADFRCQEDASEYLANARAALEAARSNMTGTRKLKMTDTTASLDALEALLAKATPGEWKAAAFSSAVGCPITAQPDPKRNTVVLAGVHGAFRDDYAAEVQANAALIVALHNTAPALIAKARRVEALEAALRDIADRPGEGVEYFPGHGDEVISECRHMELIARAALKENTDATSD